MKRKTKKRIELLELAIKVAEQRANELSECQNPLTCLLCMNMKVFDGCKNCPTDKAPYYCFKYCCDIAKIIGNLINQIGTWKQEIERLKKT